MGAIFELLAADADIEYAMIDSTMVRVHQHSAGAKKKHGENQAIGRNKGGLSIKIHTLVDAFGNPPRRRCRLANCERALAVEPQQVVLGKGESADGRFTLDAAVRSMPVVAMDPEGQLLSTALSVVGPSISPFAQGCLDEALRLTIGLGRVRPGPNVLEPSNLQASRKARDL